ncbi:hypothetical protein BM526_07315 [Alteromonas mediterranea]|nr:hypothetical protein BM526_07315 [Alteromonas mediterranea]
MIDATGKACAFNLFDVGLYSATFIFRRLIDSSVNLPAFLSLHDDCMASALEQFVYALGLA